MLFKHYLLLVLKQLWVLSLFIFIFKNLVVEYNSECMPYFTIIFFIYYSNQDLTSITINIIFHWICLLHANKKGLKVLSLIWIIGLMKYFLLLTPIIPSFLPVLELLTFSLVVFLFILLASIVKTISYLACDNLTI